MKKEIAEKWVTALRSGRYKQGEGSLRNGDTFCCLGVLCDLYDSNQWRVTPTDYEYGVDEELSSSDFLTQEVMEWAGMCSNRGQYDFSEEADSQEKTLALDNDSGLSFNRIAGLIESYVDIL